MGCLKDLTEMLTVELKPEGQAGEARKGIGASTLLVSVKILGFILGAMESH